MKILSERWREEANQLRENIPGHNETSSVRIDACARWLEACADDYDRCEKPDWLGELISALGWQGGTIHQALNAVRRLCESNNDERKHGWNKIKDQIKRRIDVTNGLPDQQLALKSMLEWIEKNEP